MTAMSAQGPSTPPIALGPFGNRCAAAVSRNLWVAKPHARARTTPRHVSIQSIQTNATCGHGRRSQHLTVAQWTRGRRGSASLPPMSGRRIEFVGRSHSRLRDTTTEACIGRFTGSFLACARAQLASIHRGGTRRQQPPKRNSTSFSDAVHAVGTVQLFAKGRGALGFAMRVRGIAMQIRGIGFQQACSNRMSAPQVTLPVLQPSHQRQDNRAYQNSRPQETQRKFSVQIQLRKGLQAACDPLRQRRSNGSGYNENPTRRSSTRLCNAQNSSLE